jgi:hypothetical protein
MAIVKIILEDGDTEASAQESLLKALTQAETGSAHQEDFHQPAGRAVLEELESLHESVIRKINLEISRLLTEEV